MTKYITKTYWEVRFKKSGDYQDVIIKYEGQDAEIDARLGAMQAIRDKKAANVQVYECEIHEEQLDSYNPTRIKSELIPTRISTGRMEDLDEGPMCAVGPEPVPDAPPIPTEKRKKEAEAHKFTPDLDDDIPF